MHKESLPFSGEKKNMIRNGMFGINLYIAEEIKSLADSHHDFCELGKCCILEGIFKV